MDRAEPAQGAGRRGQQGGCSRDSDFIFQIIKGPNARNDFHIDPYDEIFYQLSGDIFLHVIEDGKEAAAVHRGRRRLHPAQARSITRRAARRPARSASRHRAAAQAGRGFDGIASVLPVLQHAPAPGRFLVRGYRARHQGRARRLQCRRSAAHLRQMRRGAARPDRHRSLGPWRAWSRFERRASRAVLRGIRKTRPLIDEER